MKLIRNSPVFILFTKIIAIERCRTPFFSSSSITYYASLRRPAPTRMKSMVFRSFLCSLHSCTSCVINGFNDTTLLVSASHCRQLHSLTTIELSGISTS